MLWECEGSNDVGWSLKEHATGLKDFFWLLLLHFVRSSEVLDETSLDDSILFNMDLSLLDSTVS